MKYFKGQGKTILSQQCMDNATVIDASSIDNGNQISGPRSQYRHLIKRPHTIIVDEIGTHQNIVLKALFQKVFVIHSFKKSVSIKN